MSPALSKTRIALGVVMATATLATTGLAGVLALSRIHTTDTETDTASKASVGTTATTSPTPRASHSKPAPPGNGFTPASRPTATTAPSHTKTKGS